MWSLAHKSYMEEIGCLAMIRNRCLNAVVPDQEHGVAKLKIKKGFFCGATLAGSFGVRNKGRVCVLLTTSNCVKQAMVNHELFSHVLKDSSVSHEHVLQINIGYLRPETKGLLSSFPIALLPCVSGAKDLSPKESLCVFLLKCAFS